MASAEGLNRLARTLGRAQEDLDSFGLEWALVGGLAVSVRAEPRFTRDVDLAVAVADDRESERLIRYLRDRGYEILAVLEHATADRLATVRLTPPLDLQPPVIVDLLFASSGIEREIVDNATPIEVFAGMVLPVASVGDLITLKILARDDRRRPQDFDDLRVLFKESTDEDLERARTGLELVAHRGYHRNRSLIETFEQILHRGLEDASPSD